MCTRTGANDSNDTGDEGSSPTHSGVNEQFGAQETPSNSSAPNARAVFGRYIERQLASFPENFKDVI
jgi:hypothetical protein